MGDPVLDGAALGSGLGRGETDGVEDGLRLIEGSTLVVGAPDGILDVEGATDGESVGSGVGNGVNAGANDGVPAAGAQPHPAAKTKVGN